ncbi:MAG: carboxypeptidase-like regulatory domain-containing protein [Nannocystaceae bacterium]
MLRPHLLLPPLAAALAAAPAAAQDPAPAPPTAMTSAAIASDSGMISGTVSDDDDAPLADVTVRLECACMAAPQERTTDSRGTFVFGNLAPGSYTLRAYPDSGAAIVHEAALADGGLTELTVIVAAVEGPKKPTDDQAHRLGPDRHAEDHDHHPKEIWGGVGVGLVFAPFRDQSPLSPETNRITADQQTPWSGAIRGVDVRWQTFDLDRHHFPRTIGFFRSGFRKGSIDFKEGAEGPVAGQPTALEVVTVPLFFGGNLYLFRDFPVRPYAGLGFGFDVMRLAYQRADAAAFTDMSLRIGFEVHGGLEVRISNYIAITGEVMQLWSARRRLSDLPDVSNESFTALLGVAGAFPMRR